MASSSACPCSTPKLIVPEEKATIDNNESNCSSNLSQSSSSITSSTNEGATKKLTKILSAQSSLERHHTPFPIAKRFSIDADPSSIILNAPGTDLSNHLAQHFSTPDVDQSSSTLMTSSSFIGRDVSPARSPSLKNSDSYLEIPYEKGEIVDLIKLADDPNSSAHLTNDGHEVLLEHGAVI